MNTTWLTKRKGYNQQDFRIARMITIIFVVLHFWATGIVLLWDRIMVSFTTQVFALSGALGLPVLILVSLCMTIERSYHLQFRSVQSKEPQMSKVAFFGTILTMIFWGIAVFVAVMSLISYIAHNWKFIEQLSECIQVQFIFVICCVAGWIFSICMRKFVVKLRGKHLIGAVISMLLLLVVMGCVGVCISMWAYWTAENVYWEKFIEYAETYGAMAPPFSWYD